LENVVWALDQLQCTPEERFICATSLLTEEAYTWWTTVQQRVPAAQRTWEFFEAEFQKKFITEAYRDAKEKEFTYLRQNKMTVAEYEREFTRLSKYAPHMVLTEERRCKRFRDGLNYEIKNKLLAAAHTDFSLLVTRALEQEQCEIDEKGRRQRSKQKREQSGGYSGGVQPSQKKYRGGSSGGGQTGGKFNQDNKQGGASRATSVASVAGTGRGTG